MTDVYELTLGLPHTSHRGLSEHHLLRWAGHFHWESIRAAAGAPLSSLRSTDGGEVYAGFYFVEVRVPAAVPLESFRLDDTVGFAVRLRGFKNVTADGRMLMDRRGRLGDPRRVEDLLAASGEPPCPALRLASIFITPQSGNSRLRVAPPAGVDLAALPALPEAEQAHHLTRAAAESGRLGVLDESWRPVATREHHHALDVDRDTNGAGLVYFANFVAFMDTAERLALADSPVEGAGVAARSLRRRRIAYYGNAGVEDTLVVRTTVLRHPAHGDRLGFRFEIERREDGRLICLSEAWKALPV